MLILRAKCKYEYSVILINYDWYIPWCSLKRSLLPKLPLLGWTPSTLNSFSPHTSIWDKIILKSILSSNPMYHRKGLSSTSRFGVLIWILFWCRAAVKAIKKAASGLPVVEIGAGLGYWAKILRDNDVKVRPYDINPPSPGAKSVNEYHGWLPSIYDGQTLKGGPNVLTKFGKKAVLFMCYPPPDNPMASDCLRHFRSVFMTLSYKFSSKVSLLSLSSEAQNLEILRRYAEFQV